jgi:histidinol-phosphate aminotransferase
VSSSALSRRRFTGALGAALGGTLVVPARAAAVVPATAAGPSPAAGALIDLSSNENPYGPSPAALEAMTRSCESVASRYPDDAEQRALEAIARHHGVSPEAVVLGCGSSEILRLCDAAFLGPGRTLGRPSRRSRPFSSTRRRRGPRR